jgi:hypothetical protein
LKIRQLLSLNSIQWLPEGWFAYPVTVFLFHGGKHQLARKDGIVKSAKQLVHITEENA